MCPRPRPHRGRVSFCDRVRTCRRWHCHQCPSERRGEGGPVRTLHVPSHVPSHPQNAAKVRGFSRTVSAFTAETDSPLEEGGFEPLVPLQSQQDRGTGPMSPTASIRVAFVIPL